MPFTETGSQREKRKAYENKNKQEKGVEFEKKRDYELFGTTEQNIPKVDTMGNVTGMKKGGKVMKKAKRYNGEDGSEVQFESKMGPNKMIDDETRRKAMEQINLDIDAEPRITKDAPGMSKSAPSLPTRKAFVSKANKAGFAADQTGGGAALMTRKDRGSKKMAGGGSVGSASKRADGIAMKGKTRGKIC